MVTNCTLLDIIVMRGRRVSAFYSNVQTQTTSIFTSNTMSGGGHGLGLVMAIIFLAGEMAGVGVLALPMAMVGTGPAGFALIVYFTINAMFSGSRLGMCWVMITERFEEFREGVKEKMKYYLKGI